MGSSTHVVRHRVTAALAAGLALCVAGAPTALPAVAGTGSVAAKPIPTRLAPEVAAHARFGGAVAVDGDTLVVGAFNDRAPGRGAGSATVYVAADDGWAEQARLAPLHPENQASFGASVALDGDTVLIGAPSRDEGDIDDFGAAYVFVRSGTTWTEQVKLDLTTSGEDVHAASSVALEGDVAAVGVPGASDGAVEIFTRSGSTWTQQAVLRPDAGDLGFGSAVAIDGDTMVIGQLGGAHQSAYVFVGSGSTWTRQAVLVAEDTEPDDFFGDSVDVSGDTVVVGAEWDVIDGVRDAGSAYVFQRVGETWTESSKLTAEVPHEDERFGNAVTVDGDVIAVGSYYYWGTPQEPYNGAVYTFRREGDEWPQQHLLIPRRGSAGHFGVAVELTQRPSGGRTLAVGASWEDPGGAAYVYEW